MAQAVENRLEFARRGRSEHSQGEKSEALGGLELRVPGIKTGAAWLSSSGSPASPEGWLEPKLPGPHPQSFRFRGSRVGTGDADDTYWAEDYVFKNRICKGLWQIGLLFPIPPFLLVREFHSCSFCLLLFKEVECTSLSPWAGPCDVLWSTKCSRT